MSFVYILQVRKLRHQEVNLPKITELVKGRTECKSSTPFLCNHDFRWPGGLELWNASKAEPSCPRTHLLYGSGLTLATFHILFKVSKAQVKTSPSYDALEWVHNAMQSGRPACCC